MDETSPTHPLASGAGAQGGEPLTSHLPNFPPCCWDLARWKRRATVRGSGRGQRWTEETTEVGTEPGSQRDQWEQRGRERPPAAWSWVRAWEGRGPASPYLAFAGALCSGSGLGGCRPGGRACRAVTSGAARRWPPSPELANLPCPERAEVARATRAPQPAHGGGSQDTTLLAFFRFVCHWPPCACLRSLRAL